MMSVLAVSANSHSRTVTSTGQKADPHRVLRNTGERQSEGSGEPSLNNTRTAVELSLFFFFYFQIETKNLRG